MSERTQSSVAADVTLRGPVALGSMAVLVLLVGIALGRSCSPWTCPVGANEFKAKVTVCDDGHAYQLVPVDGVVTTSTEAL